MDKKRLKNWDFRGAWEELKYVAAVALAVIASGALFLFSRCRGASRETIKGRRMQGAEYKRKSKQGRT